VCSGYDICNASTVVSFVNCLGAAFLNLALNKPAYQSTQAYDDGGHAKLAVDGNPDGIYKKKSCTHTVASRMPWWAVDLESDKMVSHVQISNRVDSE